MPGFTRRGDPERVAADTTTKLVASWGGGMWRAWMRCFSRKRLKLLESLAVDYRPLQRQHGVIFLVYRRRRIRRTK